MSSLALTGGSPVVDASAVPEWPPYREEVGDAVRQVALSDGWGATNGPRTQELEKHFAARHAARHGVAVTNGSISLEIAMRALQIGRGDEVIVPAYTFIASATAVLFANALPVFVDVDAAGNIDPAAAEAAITSRTRAIMPVHFAGHSADMTALSAIAQGHDIALIEDAAQAHGAEWEGRPIGAIGAFGSFSFQSSKNLTAGEGGMLLTDDDDLAELAWSLHTCGRQRSGAWYEHIALGSNFRLTEFQSAAVLAQLSHLDADLARRERAAARLSDGLVQVGGLTPPPRDLRATMHGWHLYQAGFEADAFAGRSKAQVLAALQAEGVPVGGGYAMPLTRQPVIAEARFDHAATDYEPRRAGMAYADVEVPMAEHLCASSVWFPQHLLLGSDELIDQVVEAVAKVRAHADDL